MPVIQYEIWRANDNHSGYPEVVTNDKNLADYYSQQGYDVIEYVAYPVMD